MEETLQQQAFTTTQQNMLDYFKTHDLKYVAEDAVFRNLSTGEVHKGKAEIGAMLHFIYHVAFDAKAEAINFVITENKAVVEAYFKGRHIGEIAGVQPTEKEVDVPLCVSYDLKDGLIKEARIYMLTEVMKTQLGVDGATPPKVGYLVREIFKLKYGHFRPVKELLQEARDQNLMKPSRISRVLTDFTGDAYRLIFENGFDSMSEFENAYSNEMDRDAWQAWYKRFIDHVEGSHREILKQIF